MNAPLPFTLRGKPAPGKLRKWTAHEVALVDRLRREGLSCSQIACRIGVSKGAISGMLYARGICEPAPDKTRWRIRQLLTAGYGPRQISEWIDVPMTLALDEFARWEEDDTKGERT